MNAAMTEQSITHIALAYLAVINVATFLVYGIDKWRSTSSRLPPTGRKKAKESKRRISEATLLELAVVGGSIGAWLGMKTYCVKMGKANLLQNLPSSVIFWL